MISFSIITLFLILSLTNSVFGDVIIALRHHPSLMPTAKFKDMAATFGPTIPFMRGLVVAADPPHGCDFLAKPPNVENIDRWIVLVSRYNCTFEHKIRMAQNSSYDAVIIYNVDSNDLVPMSAKNPFGITIPSVFVGYHAGMEIKKFYQYNSEYIAIITVEDSSNFPFLIPFVLVVGICFIIMIVFMVIKFVKDRLRQHRHRLPSSSLNKIPTCKFAKGDPYDTCAICLEDYLEGEKLRVLPCAHAYHSKCIDPWLTKNRRVCPICKRKVFAYDENPIPDSDSDSDADDTTPLVNPATRNSHGTFAQQNENPFQRAARSVSQLGESDQGYQNEGMFVTSSGNHSINAEMIDSDNFQSLLEGTEEVPVNIVTQMPSTSVDNNNRDLII